jgi:hypothetical protein
VKPTVECQIGIATLFNVNLQRSLYGTTLGFPLVGLVFPHMSFLGSKARSIDDASPSAQPLPFWNSMSPQGS